MLNKSFTPKVRVEQSILGDFFCTYMFLVKNPRVSFEPDEPEYSLNMNVPNLSRRTRNAISLPVLPQVL